MAGSPVIRMSVGVRWLQVIFGAAGLFLLLAGTTASLYLYNLRVDLSPGNRFTLSDHALTVLRSLEAPVRMTAFIRTEDARNPIIKDILWQASNESPQISYTVVDVNRNPALAAQYGVDTYGATVVESGGRRSDFSLPVESQLISAILTVTRPPKKVYALTGHGQCALQDTDRHTGCSGMRDALQTELYSIDPLSLFGDREVPDDAAALLIAGPKSDPLEEELTTLGRYLDGGGKLLVMLDPYQAPKLAAFLVSYGIETSDDVVVDPENRLGGGEVYSAAVTNVNRRHLITASLDSPPLFSGARSLEAGSDEAAGRQASWLLRSGDRSWASHDPSVLEGARPTFVAGRDLNGPLTVGAEISIPVRGDGGDRTTARIIVYGDSDFATNRFLDYLGNRDLLVNTVNWLAREEQLIAPRSRRKQPGTNIFFISQEQLARIFWVSVLLQPGVFLIIGLAIVLRRRLSP